MNTQNNDMYFVTVIADYCDHNAFGRVRQKLMEKLLDAGVPLTHMQFNEVWVPFFDTRATGFDLADMARNSGVPRDGVRHIFYVNTAPRKDDTKAREDNAGEKLVYVKLKNNVEILAVNSGESLAFLKDAIDSAQHLDISDRGSQFRSLNVFPDALRRLAMNDASLFTGDAMKDLPDMPTSMSINRIEGYGNMKTNIRLDGFNHEWFGKKARIKINGIEEQVTISRRLFDDSEGVGLVLYAGSSGWKDNSSDVTFMEIGLRGASAADHLYNYDEDSYPENGMEFDLEITG